jgi:flagellar hook assembly protein FlgD
MVGVLVNAWTAAKPADMSHGVGKQVWVSEQKVTRTVVTKVEVYVTVVVWRCGAGYGRT